MKGIRLPLNTGHLREDSFALSNTTQGDMNKKRRYFGKSKIWFVLNYLNENNYNADILHQRIAMTREGNLLSNCRLLT